ncbi:hypothetical protein ACWDUL_38340 [Nocardia niigatensis]|uniref:hypothetical protein n=1 Tax=Nocardia niigatensis TaxID=209249 RepID=UPI000593AC1F|nr:hypothetical protein [Nocardia niigatensis]
MLNADLGWQRFFTWNGLLFAVFCGVGLEVFMPQPPHFDISAVATADYYVAHSRGFLTGITLCGIAMAFLLAWSLQLGYMLWQADCARIATVVAIVSLAASPILLSFDLAFFAVAVYRAGEVNPDVTQAFSDVAWIGSMLIWPQLGFSMLLVGILILRQRGRAAVFPAWLGWLSIAVAVVEPGQAGIIFAKNGPFAPDAVLTWYAAVFTWGSWIVALTVVMLRRLPSQSRDQITGRAVVGVDATTA